MCGVGYVDGVRISALPLFVAATKGGHSASARSGEMFAVEIPSDIAQIGDCAFERCSGLTQITLPPGPFGLAKIARCAFYRCRLRCEAAATSPPLQSVANCSAPDAAW